MKQISVFLLTIYHYVKFACSIPRLAWNAMRQHRPSAPPSDFEIERLDRLRNPSHYLGK